MEEDDVIEKWKVDLLHALYTDEAGRMLFSIKDIEDILDKLWPVQP